jgi:hypothetical protein
MKALQGVRWAKLNIDESNLNSTDNVIKIDFKDTDGKMRVARVGIHVTQPEEPRHSSKEVTVNIGQPGASTCSFRKTWLQSFERFGAIGVGSNYEDILIVGDSHGANWLGENYFLFNPKACKVARLYLANSGRSGRRSELCDENDPELRDEVDLLKKIRVEIGYGNTHPWENPEATECR